jgi:uncharacterized lipoprotein YbaY
MLNLTVNLMSSFFAAPFLRNSGNPRGAISFTLKLPACKDDAARIGKARPARLKCPSSRGTSRLGSAADIHPCTAPPDKHLPQPDRGRFHLWRFSCAYRFLALLALALLSGCNSSAPPPPQAAPAPKVANSVSGKVMLREPRELSAQTRLELRVTDVAQPGLILAQTTVTPANQPPISFNLPIDTSKVDPRRTYAVEAMLIDGERRYLPVLQYPVLTHNAAAQVEIVVAPEATPAEKMYDEFKEDLQPDHAA